MFYSFALCGFTGKIMHPAGVKSLNLHNNGEVFHPENKSVYGKIFGLEIFQFFFNLPVSEDILVLVLLFSNINPADLLTNGL